MKFAKKKIMTSLIALFLVSTIALTQVSSPVAKAHLPSWKIPTWTYVAVAPETVGAGQEVLIAFWLNSIPPTASGSYGDRWSFIINITKPDGSREILNRL